MLRGVTDVKCTPAKSTLKSSYDKSHDDLEHGRVNVYDNPEELFDKLGL